jgi:SAM-dependent methyltransferase
MQLLDAIRSGYYAQGQLFSRSRLVSWSHRGRFATGLRLARLVGGGRVLDYGCGDGTFLALMLHGESAPRVAVGTELHPHTVDDCRRRFAGDDRLQFLLVDDLDDAGARGSYDAIYCMEVFEHVVDPSPVLDRLERLLAPGGSVVISVPIETGLPVIVKQMVRRIAGWRGIGHYPGTTGYSFAELLRSIFAGSRQHIPRPVFTAPDGTRFHDHKGFNWGVLRGLICERFELIHQTTSPIAWLGPQFGTQRWFVARKKETA